MIVVEPTSGLCSRIYVICDAYELAKKYKKKLVILWSKTTDCNIGYYKIFDCQQFDDINVKVIEFSKFRVRIKDIKNISVSNLFLIIREILHRLLYYVKYNFIKFYYRKKCQKYKNAYQDGNRPIEEELVKNNSCYIEAYNMITEKESDLSVIKFNDSLVQKAKKIMGAYEKKCIGIHIRRTDHEPAKRHSSTSKFVIEMKRILKDDNETFFYLATDDWNEENDIKSIFSDHIITQKSKVLNRFTEEGMQSSIIDCLCLSKTKYIIGSYTSFFSKFSAQYGGIELKIL